MIKVRKSGNLMNKKIVFSIMFLSVWVLMFSGCWDDSGGDQSLLLWGPKFSDPAQPEVTELRAVAKDSQVVLSWVDPAEEGLTGIQVIWSESGTEKSVLVKLGDQTCTIAHLENGTGYRFTVKTVDTTGGKSAGESVGAMPEPQKIGEVEKLAAYPGDFEVTFEWADPEESDFDHIEVTWDPDGTTPQVIAKGANKHAATGLGNGEKYTFLFRSVGITGYKSNGVSILASTNMIYPVVSAGADSSFFIQPGKQLYCAGSNAMGQFGNGVQEPFNELPIKVTSRAIKAVASGNNHSLILESNGDLWTTGDNTYGQLGDGTKTTRLSPVKIATGVKAVAAGYSHSYFLKNDGTLWAMGHNDCGQMGDGTTTNRLSPVQIRTGVTTVAAGSDHGLFVATDSTLWAMGGNGNGALGDGTRNERHYPVPIMTGVSAVASGARLLHSLVLKPDGTLYGMGWNQFGQLGLGDTTTRTAPVRIMSGVKKMAAGINHSLVVTTDGTLYAMGSNANGQLGDGTVLARYSPVQIMTGVYDVAAGANYSIIVKTDGSIWANGINTYGQLGDGMYTERHSAVRVDLPGGIAANIRSAGGTRTAAFIAVGALALGLATLGGIFLYRRWKGRA
jgi:alpha-tubulin suppressor-like RCC1 family protein